MFGRENRWMRVRLKEWSQRFLGVTDFITREWEIDVEGELAGPVDECQ